MAFWWVVQNKTFRHERAGGYLWAPVFNRVGGRHFHWDNMEELQPGDVVFSYVQKRIVAVAVVESRVEACPRPAELASSGEPWEIDGRRVAAVYRDLESPVDIP